MNVTLKSLEVHLLQSVLLFPCSFVLIIYRTHCICCLIDSSGCCSDVWRLWCINDIKRYRYVTVVRAFVSVTISDRSPWQAADF